MPRWDGALGYQPCCWMKTTIPVSTKQELDQARQQFEDLVMSDPETHCAECIRRETIGKYPSHRQQAMSRVPDHAQHGDVNRIDLQFDITCNAACVMCGPDLSSLWRKKSNIPEIHNYQSPYDLMDLDKVTSIKLLGGEPMLSDSYRGLLKRIPAPEKVHVSYTTNGSVSPDEELTEIWSRYRRVNFTFSIDDTHDRFGYIRWPLRWNKIEQNHRYFLNNFKNSTVGINCTVNALSVFYVDQLESWATQCGTHDMKFSKCFGVWALSACPDGLRAEIKQKLGPTHEVSIMLDHEPADIQHTQALVDFMNKLDAQRGTNWRETFAEIQHYF